MNLERKLTNQDAFDTVVLHLLNQGHRCFSASGKSQYRGPRGKNAIGALIPDEWYTNSMEGKTIHQLLASSNADYAKLRLRFGAVSPKLLTELSDLHDRMSECLPSLFRHLVLAGGQQIARAFGLSARLPNLSAVYRTLPGPRLPQTGTEPRPIPFRENALAVANG